MAAAWAFALHLKTVSKLGFLKMNLSQCSRR
jgi:hypothetical protein